MSVCDAMSGWEMSFPINLHTPVAYAGPPPEEADVVVIGGGVAGVSAALFLARAGRRVVLCEKGRVAAEQSSRNWGWVRQQGRDPDELPIMVEAARHWRAFAEEADQDFGLRRCGVTFLAKTEEQLAGYEAWLPFAQTHEVDTRLLSRRETAALIPGAARSYAGALHTASDMRAEPLLAVPALARLAARAGVSIVENCAVRALDVAAGAAAGVVTEAGMIRCGQVVLAGGVWSARFLRAHGVALPQLSVRLSVAATQALPEIADSSVSDRHLAFRRRMDGGYTIAQGGYHELPIGPDAFRALPKFLTQLRANPFGTHLRGPAPRGYPDGWRLSDRIDPDRPGPFEAFRVLDPPANRAVLARAARQLEALFPNLPPVRLSRVWGGMADVMPDVVPVVDRVAAIPGLVVGTGFSGHGFGIGPGFGRVLADLVMGRDPGHDLRRFRLSRFSDGSVMELGPAL